MLLLETQHNNVLFHLTFLFDSQEQSLEGFSSQSLGYVTDRINYNK